MALLVCVALAVIFGVSRRGGKGGSKQLGADNVSESSQVQHSQVELHGRNDATDLEPSQTA